MLIPSPLVALPAIAIRIVGYSLAGLGLRRAGVLGLSIPSFTTKRAVAGFVAGVAYWVLVFALTPASFHGAPAYVGLALPRTLVWFALVWPYLSAQQREGLGWTLPLLGTLLSYALDVVTSGLVHVLPGMTMPWC